MANIPNVIRVPGRYIKSALRRVNRESRSLLTPRRLARYDRLQLGAGPNPLPGWANIDLIGPNLRWDLRRPLPLKGRSLKFIYSEHFIEHVSRADGLMILTNCRKAMAPGGVLRISTPDLRVLLADYMNGNLIEAEHGAWKPATLCCMVNEAMRFWGHQFIYDADELASLLKEAGFVLITRVDYRKSEHAELRNRETRPHFDDLIMEAKAA